MKKNYKKPKMEVVKLRGHAVLQQASGTTQRVALSETEWDEEFN